MSCRKGAEQEGSASSGLEAVTCGLCWDVFVDPVTFGCGHSFCLPCVSEWTHLAVGQRRCPLCGQAAPAVPPVSIALRNIVETMYAAQVAERRKEIERDRAQRQEEDRAATEAQAANTPQEVPDGERRGELPAALIAQLREVRRLHGGQLPDAVAEHVARAHHVSAADLRQAVEAEDQEQEQHREQGPVEEVAPHVVGHCRRVAADHGGTLPDPMFAHFAHVFAVQEASLRRALA